MSEISNPWERFEAQMPRSQEISTRQFSAPGPTSTAAVNSDQRSSPSERPLKSGVLGAVRVPSSRLFTGAQRTPRPNVISTVYKPAQAIGETAMRVVVIPLVQEGGTGQFD